ncbi:hypothetical protein GCM10027040_30590 [Halomonas shantousis]
MKSRETVPSVPVAESLPIVESLRWPDEDERLTIGSVEGAGEFSCACHFSDMGMQASLARELYSLVLK